MSGPAPDTRSPLSKQLSAWAHMMELSIDSATQHFLTEKIATAKSQIIALKPIPAQVASLEAYLDRKASRALELKSQMSELHNERVAIEQDIQQKTALLDSLRAQSPNPTPATPSSLEVQVERLGAALALVAKALPNPALLPPDVLALLPVHSPAPAPVVVIDPVAPTFGPSMASPTRRPQPYPSTSELPTGTTAEELDSELQSAIATSTKAPPAQPATPAEGTPASVTPFSIQPDAATVAPAVALDSAQAPVQALTPEQMLANAGRIANSLSPTRSPVFPQVREDGSDA